ncbi:hypothetical protein BDE36_3478 [Arcticibacter tournemirensis]|uniref:Uncharacterized protein n=1 Tax=Arcticibacter tournemirensis TaxID=699437 RepID=A0A4Q0M437_9SPHI|nr:hypothetical protein [Arcticibacter tournemirensis]KAA8482420.1 hypothetical protein F1649_11965 [Arcticibacter tournemirensis]RXF67708.1 hypothetical protein EKH83_17925 [Arcticibacter tournemirensis]TQM51695.1 hypothetical protein BDE36_3478 [Arcticibacter tournemirensis]
MKVTIEIDSKNDFKKLTALFKSLDIDSIEVVSNDDIAGPAPVKRGNKKIDPNDLFGIWADNPRSLDAIRKDAWHRS